VPGKSRIIRSRQSFHRENSINRPMPQRGIAYQPGATLRVSYENQVCVLKERRISVDCHSAFDGYVASLQDAEICWGVISRGCSPGWYVAAPLGRREWLRNREEVHWFLDEIQLVPGWERFVRRVMDSEKMSLVVSGSSARMLSREVHTSLRGRGMETIIRPFGFREFLRHRNEEPGKPPERWTAAERSLMERFFGEFLARGGFPEAQGLDAALRIELLQGYVDTLLFRDVVERHGVSQVAALRWVVRQCLRNPARGFSVHRLHHDLRSQGHGIGKDAVHAMMGHLLDAFLISVVPLATESERQRNSNPRKIYPADPALIGAFDASGRSNIGHALETAVLHELERRKAEVGYVKCGDGLEVDFLARHPRGGEELIQVCADLADPKTRARELRALEIAARQYPGATCRVLVLNRDGASGANTPGVMIEPAGDWMLRSEQES
jgi:uncharacterized protein